MKTQLSFILFFAFLFCSSQEIADKEKFKKCIKEFSKKICLSDEDKDSVLFYLDECPKVFGVAENNGCAWADTDNDGIFDKDDACPDVSGPEENHGCPWPDTDGDGILDKDDKCPTVAGRVEDNGCKSYEPHRYSQEELDKVQKEFLEQTKNINYEKLADFIFNKINDKYFDSKIVTVQIASFAQMAGCGFDRTDYSAINLKVNLASEKFWNENNFRKFVNKFPSKIIFPYSENEEINKKIQSFRKIYSKKNEGITFYNAKNNFKELNNKEINPYKSFQIYIFFDENDVIYVRTNDNTELGINIRLKHKGNTFIQLD